MDRPPTEAQSRKPIRMRHRQGLVLIALASRWLLAGLFVPAKSHGFAGQVLLAGPFLMFVGIIVGPPVWHWSRSHRETNGTREV
jgi:hypothetical protein